jgi:hypothetical protein
LEAFASNICAYIHRCRFDSGLPEIKDVLDSAKISHQIHAAPPDSCHHHSDLEGIRTCAIQQEKAKCNNNNQQIEKEAETSALTLLTTSPRIPRLKVRASVSELVRIPHLRPQLRDGGEERAGMDFLRPGCTQVSRRAARHLLMSPPCGGGESSIGEEGSGGCGLGGAVAGDWGA